MNKNKVLAATPSLAVNIGTGIGLYMLSAMDSVNWTAGNIGAILCFVGWIIFMVATIMHLAVSLPDMLSAIDDDAFPRYRRQAVRAIPDQYGSVTVRLDRRSRGWGPWAQTTTQKSRKFSAEDEADEAYAYAAELREEAKAIEAKSGVPTQAMLVAKTINRKKA